MWRTLLRATRVAVKPTRATNVNIFNVRTNKRKNYASDSKGLVEKIELDKMLNDEIDRLKKNKKLLPEDDVVPAEYKSILKELDIQYERTLEDCREAVRDPEFKEYWSLLTSRIRAAEMAWAKDTTPITKQSKEAFDAHIEDIIQTTDEEFFSMMKERRIQEKQRGIKPPEPNDMTDTNADELIRNYLGLGIDLNPESLKSLDAVKMLREMPELEINKRLEEGEKQRVNKISTSSNKDQQQQPEESGVESKSVAEAIPNLPTTELNNKDKLYDEYERLMMFSNRDMDDQSRAAAADRILGHIKMREREQVLKERKERTAKEDAQLEKDVNEMMNRNRTSSYPDSLFELPDLFGHDKKK